MSYKFPEATKKVIVSNRQQNASDIIDEVLCQKDSDYTECLNNPLNNFGGTPIEIITEMPVDQVNTPQPIQESKPIVIYANIGKKTTLRSILNEVKQELSDAISSCYLTDNDFLSLVKSALREFLLITGESKFNSFLARTPITVEKDREYYCLPDNFDVHTNLFINKTCDLCLQPEMTNHLRFTYVPFEAWSDNTKNFAYSISGNRLYISLSIRQKETCYCQAVEPEIGHITLEYYYLPDINHIRSLDEEISWLPRHMASVAYLIEILKEKVLFKVSKQNYSSPTKTLYYKQLMKAEHGNKSINSTQRVGKPVFLFK